MNETDFKQSSFLVTLDLYNRGAFGEVLALAGNAFPIGLDQDRISQDGFDPSVRLTHCDILPGFLSSELRKRDPFQRLHSVLVLRRASRAQHDGEECHKNHNRRDALALHVYRLGSHWRPLRGLLLFCWSVMPLDLFPDVFSGRAVRAALVNWFSLEWRADAPR
jgi:hypothetical protein